MAPASAPLHDPDLAAEVIRVARRMSADRLTTGTSGNVSARVPGGFLVTPSGVPYEALTPDRIVPVDMDGHASGPWAPSSEWRMHLDIYRAFPAAKAIVHVHSTHATAYSCLRRDLPPFHYMIAVAGGSTIRCARYATFGTQELSDAMVEALDGRKACLLANHGQIAFGPSLDKALWLAHEVEALCEQYMLACRMGEPVILDEAEMARVAERFATYGKQPAAGEAAA